MSKQWLPGQWSLRLLKSLYNNAHIKLFVVPLLENMILRRAEEKLKPKMPSRYWHIGGHHSHRYRKKFVETLSISTKLKLL